MLKRNTLLISVVATLLVQDSNGFSSCGGNGNSVNGMNHRTPSRIDMVSPTSTGGGDFFDDFNPHRRDGNDGKDSSFSNHIHNNRVQDESSSGSSMYVSGDDLHRLRHQVLAMRLELQEARRNEDVERVRNLERAIMKTQQVDAEFVYTVSLERHELAQQAGNIVAAQEFLDKAMEARSALPQFQLEGLWVGKYGEDQGYEMINVTYHGDTLLAHKVTSGTKHVPRGEETFRVDLAPHFAKESPGSNNRNNRHADDTIAGQRQQQEHEQDEVLSPIELGDSAAEQWGCKYLQRFSGQGQVASEGYQDSQWMTGQLILVNEYFSFAWLPIGHQVFFGRPTPELILKLMKDENKRGTANDHLSPSRSFLEKCWEETEHMEDEMEVDRQQPLSASTCFYYDQEGCFE